MSSSKDTLSTIGKKFLMGLTGLALVVFVILHLAGNLLLLHPDSEPFNAYAHKLESFGNLLYVVEAALAAVFLIHAAAALSVTWGNRRARPVRYAKTAAAGGPSRRNISSVSMIYTGLILLAFLVWHLWDFKFGPGMAQGYMTQIDGERVRDLYRLVVEAYQNPIHVFSYVFVMLLLGVHVRHGFWSAFQSLGANHPRYTSIIYGVGAVLALILAVGFLGIPIWIYVRGGAL